MPTPMRILTTILLGPDAQAGVHSSLSSLVASQSKPRPVILSPQSFPSFPSLPHPQGHNPGPGPHQLLARLPGLILIALVQAWSITPGGGG